MFAICTKQKKNYSFMCNKNKDHQPTVLVYIIGSTLRVLNKNPHTCANLMNPLFSFKTLNSLTVTTFFSFQKWRRPLGSFHHFIVQWHYRHPIFYHYQSSSDLFGLQSGRWGGHRNPSFSLSHSAQRIFIGYALWTVSFD